MLAAIAWLIALQAPAAHPRPDRPASPYLSARIPLAFRGTWAGSAAMCRDRNSTGRAKVHATGVDYFESAGRVERVTPSARRRSINVAFSYEGEGQAWRRSEYWALSGRGDRLTMRPKDGGATSHWLRCR